MSHADFAVNFFVTLFALLNPLGNVPIFAAATVGVSSRDRARIAAYVALFVLGFTAFFFFTGLALLAFFGISLAAFRIAGGVILLLMGLHMTRDDFTATFADAADTPDATAANDAPHEHGYARRRFERMIVPVAMPLLIGPGAISTVVISASEARAFGLAGAVIGVGVLAAASACTLLAFLATPLVTRVLGRIGLTIVVRVLGLILCAMAVQFILGGLADATTGLINPEAATPYS